MTFRSHIHDEVFEATPEEIFKLLYTPSAIRQWWSASRVIVLPEPNGVWAAAWGENEDEPDYITTAIIREFEPPVRMVLTNYRYFARGRRLPFEVHFITEFLVTAHENGTVLRVTQDGFPAGPEGDGFYAECQSGWKNTFAGIRKYLKL
jgi:uncharacterized protein YndB with AHSA1/START domain